MTLGKCLTELQSGSDGNKWFPKTKFTEYTGIKGKTPQNLSIDHHQNFVNTHPDLSREGMYLFRLGRGTFSLVQAKTSLRITLLTTTCSQKAAKDMYHLQASRTSFPSRLCPS